MGKLEFCNRESDFLALYQIPVREQFIYTNIDWSSL